MRLSGLFALALFAVGSMTTATFASPEMDAAEKKFIQECLAKGYTLKQGGKPHVLICTTPSGNYQQCDFSGSFGVCFGGQSDVPAYNQAKEIGKQQSKCIANGGTFKPGPGRSTFTCEFPDGGGQTCVYGPQFAVCYGFESGPKLKMYKPLVMSDGGKP